MKPNAGTYVLAAAMFVGMLVVYVTSFTIAPNLYMRVLAAILGMLALVGTWLAVASSLPPARVRVMDIATGVVGTMATFLLARDLGVEPVVAVSLVLVTLGIAQSLGIIDFPATCAGFSGGFVGLIGPSITVSWWWVALSGAIAGTLWSMIGPSVMPAFGGRIGLMAFLGSAISYEVADFLGGRGNAVLLPPTDGLPTWAVMPVGITGALVTWLLRNRTDLNYMYCVGLPALTVSAGIALAPGLGSQGAVMATAWLGGAALAGTALTRLPNAGWIFLAALLYSGLMVRFTGPYEGHAGVIGVLAFIGELGTFGLRRTLQRVAPRLPGKPRVA
ncbi:MAG: hypothetical protein ACKORG_00780 [Actinomycetota bacterium]